VASAGKSLLLVTILLLTGSMGIWLLTKGKPPATGLAAIHVPAGFTVERVAGPNLAAYAMMGTIDDRGRLFLCESSGNTVQTQQMAARPDYRIRMLEDLNGDGVYDRSTVFATKLTLPAGAVWYRGSLYVAAPPDLLRLEDDNGDGVADRREVVVTGWNLSSNAASLHGPFLGPDGWLYLTDGRHGFHIKTKDGKTFQGMAARIWRVRPDGTGLEWVSGGGFDNPVELIFTPPGEIIGTMTYFTDPRDGQRDALLHFVEGGVYPKWFPVVSEFKRTGDLMPVMTKFPRIAPAGLLRYRGAGFGREYEGNLFSAQFNPHRVQRHRLFREGATFRTEDEDFLTSSDPDFHPTDVIEDADGSLLVVDTGAWFIHGCPISRIARPQIKGGIYRIRKTGAPVVRDPYGKEIQLEAVPPAELARMLEDPRPAVQDRALDLLVQAGEAAVGPLAALRESSRPAEIRCAAVFALSRIGTAAAEEAVRAALSDPDFQVRTAAARSVGMAKDRAAVERLMAMARRDEPAARRQAASALGQIGDSRAVPALLAAAADAGDRFIEHAVIYSLIGLADRRTTLEALRSPQPRVRKAALIALDQMDATPLERRHLGPFLTDPDKELRGAALWVVSHHPDWAGEVLKFLRARLGAPELPADEAAGVQETLLAFCSDAGVQEIVAGALGAKSSSPERQLFLLDTMDRCKMKEFPAVWVQQLGRQLDAPDVRVQLRAVALIRSRAIAALDGALEQIAENGAAAEELRMAALGALAARRPKISPADFAFLAARLDPKVDASSRFAAAEVLGRSDLSSQQRLILAQRYLPQADPLVMPSLLQAFRNAKSEDVGMAFVSGLLKSSSQIGEAGKQIQETLKAFPPSVQRAARPLLARIEEEERSRMERLQKLEPLLTAGGDAGRGRQIFFGRKVGCSRCHTIGSEGGHVGPDLTGVGAIRSGHDLLEAIVFPGASFVPGYEVYRVETATDTLTGLIVQRTPEYITLLTGPDGQERIPRNKILAIKPSNVSLMPDGFDEALSQAELADLLAFLQAQKSRENVLAMSGARLGREP
jgi:putative membrane-bound dehydrogenase-like protein